MSADWDLDVDLAPGVSFLSALLACLLGKYLAYEIPLFLARAEHVALISIQAIAIISHQIDFSFIYVSCLLQDALESVLPPLRLAGLPHKYL